MKILHLSTSVVKQSAAYRLHRGLLAQGVDSKVMVGTTGVEDPTVLLPSPWQRINASIKHRLELLLQKNYQRTKGPFSPGVFSSIPHSALQHADTLYHLHWICSGFLSTASLKRIHQPVVWTLHDSWAFTGGCHVPQECLGYLQNCGSCPVLSSQKEADLSRRVLSAKKRQWGSQDFVLVTPSQWLAGCARRSALFQGRRVEVIPNGVDTELYHPVDRRFAKSMLGLNPDDKLILFGAVNSLQDPNKGFQHLKAALQILRDRQWDQGLSVSVFGDALGPEAESLWPNLRGLGKLSDDISLVLAYAAADVFIAPSLQENFPNTILEAMACGTPSVAFRIGGIPDQIESGFNGYLAEPFSPEDLATGIRQVLENGDKMGENAREKAEREFTIARSAARYLDLYQEVLASS